nr:uncharacterized protein LOC112778986 [Arachis hypogaea]
MNYFLGIEVKQSSNKTVTLKQTKYILDLLKRAEMSTAKPVPTPMTSSLKLSAFGHGSFNNPTLYRLIVGGAEARNTSPRTHPCRRSPSDTTTNCIALPVAGGSIAAPWFTILDFKIPRKVHFKKGTRVEPPRQQPPATPPVFSPSDDDDWLIPPPPSNGGVSTAAPLQPFHPPRSEPRPEPQAANGSQVTEPCNEDIDPEANEVDSFDEHIDRMFAASDAGKRKGQKTTEFWDVDLIDSEGIVKQAKMSVREAMERSLNGSKIILRFNEELQAVGDGAGMLSGILGALGSDYSKFPICEKSWAKVRGKDRVYDDCIKEMFHFQDSSGRIKKTLLKQMGRSWKDTRGRLYDSHYKPTLTLEQNLEKRPEGILREHWRWFIDYRNDPATKAKCKQNALNR